MFNAYLTADVEPKRYYTMKYICPLLVVTDMQRSRHFYEKLLKLRVKFDFGENISFEGDFALHLETHYIKLLQGTDIRFGGNDAELYFEHNDLEPLVARLQEANVEFVHPIMEQPWRQLVVRFYDPDRHVIEVGESMEHLSMRLFKEGLNMEQIAATTQLPAEYVSQLLGIVD